LVKRNAFYKRKGAGKLDREDLKFIIFFVKGWKSVIKTTQLVEWI